MSNALRLELGKRSALGAAVLDAKHPGWAAKIDRDSLDLGSCTLCVLGQLYGSDDKGTRNLFGNIHYKEYYAKQEDHGFYAPSLEKLGLEHLELNRDQVWEGLRDCWIAEIEARIPTQA